MGASQSRRQRRAYEKLLKKNNPKLYKQYKESTKEKGTELHRQNVQRQLDENQNIGNHEV